MPHQPDPIPLKTLICNDKRESRLGSRARRPSRIIEATSTGEHHEEKRP